MEQPIISKHCHALLNVPPIHRDVKEIARGSNKHGRHLASCRTVILIQNSHLFPDQSPKAPNIQAIPGPEKACFKFTTFSGFPGSV